MVIVENNKQTIDDHFKKKKRFWPQNTKSERKVRFGQIFFENDPLDELNMIGRVRNFFTVPNNAQMPEKWPNSPHPLYTARA